MNTEKIDHSYQRHGSWGCRSPS